MVELKKMNWRDYIQSDNPVAAALLAKMGYSKDEKVQVNGNFTHAGKDATQPSADKVYHRLL